MKTRLIKDLGNMNPGELEPKAWNGGDDSGDVDEVDAAVGAPEGGPANDISVDVDDGLDAETKANMHYLVKSV